MFCIGATTRLNAAFGQGTGPIILGDVGCTGVESRLIDCANTGLGIDYCSHSRDVGVVCIQGTVRIIVYIKISLLSIIIRL